MQSQQMAQMAAMNASNGSVDGPPMMNNKRLGTDPREQLNTYIYDYFLRNSHFKLAKAMLDSSDTVKMSTGPPQKPSPNNRPNGVDPIDQDGAEGFPTPQLPPNQMADNSFLLDWWVQFWDIYQATKARTGPSKGNQYIQHTRNLTQMQNEQRNQRMMMNNPMSAQYQMMTRNGMPNGVQANDLKRAAAMNNRPNGNPIVGVQMKNPAMMAAQMQRDGSGMEMNGQRPQSPGSNENAPSPNKRPRVEGGMNGGNMPNNQFGEFAQQGQNSQQKIEGMNSGVQGSPMAHPGLDGQETMFAGNVPRSGMPPNGAPGAQQGNHALQDYQMQLMLLEQQNKKRLLMARQEQDNMSGPHQQGGVGAPGFATAMSPQGSRAGPSPNPTDMKRGTPKLGQQVLPGSPMPDGMMQPQRGSPAPNMNFDPNQVPPGMPPQYYSQQQMPQNLRPPPSSHPGANFNAQQLTPQQVEAMRAGQMQNTAWRGQQQPGMMPAQQQMGGPMGQNPQRQMPPPPAPSNEQPRPEPSPSQSNQAPPTPNQTNKANPKKKVTKENKPANKKGGNTGAAAANANGDEPPTPTSSTPVAPITPQHKSSFNGQQQPVQQATQQQTMDNNGPPFGNIGDGTDAPFDLNFSLDESGALENFDFDSFLHTNDDNGFGNLVGEFDFSNAPEVGGGDI
ncbi:hypothetical protein T440DRAFT_311054 [Plenodomus tracheiphilus IPT5]|uniref:Uncharacterized protein n=1 Tax=Plenodomus tracheiphilus IPT5 TaxID=1408161 RepID=A0A6A7BEA9_9PLEO|nr:hypothetical protein T440DRAFT_311054 [Plenodomus tracheiphilus IPT5]